MREAAKYYDEAYAKAWTAITNRLDAVRRKLNSSGVQLEELSYDGDSYISQIEELPGEPKAPSADEVEVKVKIDAVFRVIR